MPTAIQATCPPGCHIIFSDGRTLSDPCRTGFVTLDTIWIIEKLLHRPGIVKGITPQIAYDAGWFTTLAVAQHVQDFGCYPEE